MFTWLAAPVPAGMGVRQVYGFLFAGDGRVLLRVDNGWYSLPGGRPEADETWPEVLRRESLEEVNVVVRAPALYLGYQRVDDGGGTSAYAQVRMVARIDAIGPRRPDPDTGRTYERRLVHPGRAGALLNWGEHGHQQAAAAAETAAVAFRLPRADLPPAAFL